MIRRTGPNRHEIVSTSFVQSRSMTSIHRSVSETLLGSMVHTERTLLVRDCGGSWSNCTMRQFLSSFLGFFHERVPPKANIVVLFLCQNPSPKKGRGKYSIRGLKRNRCVPKMCRRRPLSESKTKDTAVYSPRNYTIVFWVNPSFPYVRNRDTEISSYFTPRLSSITVVVDSRRHTFRIVSTLPNPLYGPRYLSKTTDGPVSDYPGTDVSRTS